MWAYLEEGVHQIMTRPNDGISIAKYMNLYTVVVNYCTSSRMHGDLDSTVGLSGRSQCFLSSIHPSLTRRLGRIQLAPILGAQICTTISSDTSLAISLATAMSVTHTAHVSRLTSPRPQIPW
jgi:hypothetical protein